jgi:hypothetical protein
MTVCSFTVLPFAGPFWGAAARPERSLRLHRSADRVQADAIVVPGYFSLSVPWRLLSGRALLQLCLTF